MRRIVVGSIVLASCAGRGAPPTGVPTGTGNGSDGSAAATPSPAGDDDDGGRGGPISPLGRNTAGAMAPLAKVANPSGPASRAPDGSIILPGGPLSAKQADCSADNDQCTRGTRWCSGMPGMTDHVPCFKLDGTWYSWVDRKALQPTAAWLTLPATMDLIIKGTVIVFVPPDPAKEIVLPRSERESLGERHWKTVAVESIEDATQTFVAGDVSYPVASARILVVDPAPLRMSRD